MKICSRVAKINSSAVQISVNFNANFSIKHVYLTLLMLVVDEVGGPITEHLEVSRIGAFGNSIGGLSVIFISRFSLSKSKISAL